MIYAIAAVAVLVAIVIAIWLAYKAHVQYEESVRQGTLAELDQYRQPYANDPAYLKDAESRN